MKTIRIALIAIAAGLSVLPLCAEPPNGATTAPAPEDLSNLDKLPTPIKRVQPSYPAELKAARVTGEAVISFVVDANGSVKNLRVEKATEPAFGEAALAAVAAWEFEPGRKNGKPVNCQLSIPLRFTLSN